MQFNMTPNASAWGICAAIAEFYGFTSPTRLFSSMGLRAPLKWYLYTQDEVDRLLSHSSLSNDVKRGHLLDTLPLASTFETKIHSHHLKVCKQCLREGILHNFEWQAVESTVCIKHQMPLVKSCAHMYVDDDWADSIQCKECQPEIPLTATKPEYAHYLEKLCSSNEREAFIAALKTVAERMIRPLDFITSTIRWTKLEPKQVEVLLEDAFKLGGSANVTTIWLEMLSNHRSNLELLGKFAMTIELDSLKSTLGRVFWTYESDNQRDFEPADLLAEYHSASIPHKTIAAQNRYKYCQDPEDFSFMVTGVHAAALLGVHPKAITELTVSGELKSIHNCKQPDKQLFDIRDIKHLLFNGNAEESEPASDFISVDDIPSAIYELYDLTPELLVQSALSGNTESQIRVNSTLQYVNKLQVTTEGLKKLLKQAWASLRDCPFDKVAKMLRTNTQIIEKLVDEGYLSQLSSDTSLIAAPSIQSFVDEYLLVNRKATFNQARNIALKISSCCGVKPVFSMYMNPTKTDFVVFRKSELSPCCMQHIPKRFAHFATPRVDLSKDVHSLFTNFSEDSNGHRYS